MQDSFKRSLLKSISWRIIGSSTTLLIAFLLTGSITVAGSIAINQFIANTILYFLHERIWNKIPE
jgi:uncharacterized membrane protein